MDGQDNNQNQVPPQGNPYQAPQDSQYNPYQPPQQPNPYQQETQYSPYQTPQDSQYNPYQQPPQPNPYQQGTQYNPYQAPQSNPYQQGGYYGQPPVVRQNNGNAIAGMVLGIVSIVLCYVWYLGLAAGIVGLVLSNLVRKQGPNKMAQAGLICSIIGLALSAMITLIWLAV